MEAPALRSAARRAGAEEEARGPRPAGRPEARGRRRADLHPPPARPRHRRPRGASARPPGPGEHEPRGPPGDGPGPARDLDGRGGGAPPLQNRRALEDAAAGPGAAPFRFALASCRVK